MLKKAAIHWAIGIVAVLLTVHIMAGTRSGIGIKWHSVWGMVAFVPVLGLVNALLGSFLRLISLPISCATLGLFGLVINAVVFLVAGRLTGANTMSGTPVGAVSAFIGSVLYTVISSLLSLGAEKAGS